jgi:hypothetical protein
MLRVWFTSERFDQALMLVVAMRTRRRADVDERTFEMLSFEMSSCPASVRMYRSGERVPSQKSLYHIDNFLQDELGADWPKAVDAALDEAGRNGDRPAHTALAEGVF